MKSYIELPWIEIYFIVIAILLAEIGNIWSIIYAYRTKKKGVLRVSVILFVLSYLLQELTLQTIELRNSGNTEGNTNIILDSPSFIVISIIIMISTMTIAVVYYNFWFRKTNVTPTAIKDFTDQIPVGMCYYLDGGRIIFQNREMNRLCVELIGKTLLNGEELYEAVKDGIVTFADNTVRQFEHRMVKLRDVEAHELIAFDITELTGKTKILESENDELKNLNASLKDYNLKIDDTVRREEILQARVNIHDEMNRLILMTMAAAEDDANTSYADIMKLWKDNIILLNRHNDAEDDIVKPIKKLADMLGVSLQFTGDDIAIIPEKYREIFSIAAREAVANSTKHANAAELVINIEVDEDTTHFSFSNDGVIPKGEIKPAGGLANLKTIAMDNSGSLEISVTDRFTFSINLANRQG